MIGEQLLYIQIVSCLYIYIYIVLVFLVKKLKSSVLFKNINTFLLQIYLELKSAISQQHSQH